MGAEGLGVDGEEASEEDSELPLSTEVYKICRVIRRRKKEGLLDSCDDDDEENSDDDSDEDADIFSSNIMSNRNGNISRSPGLSPRLAWR